MLIDVAQVDALMGFDETGIRKIRHRVRKL